MDIGRSLKCQKATCNVGISEQRLLLKVSPVVPLS